MISISTYVFYINIRTNTYYVRSGDWDFSEIASGCKGSLAVILAESRRPAGFGQKRPAIPRILAPRSARAFSNRRSP